MAAGLTAVDVALCSDCGHQSDVHHHLRQGLDCSLCTCDALRTETRPSGGRHARGAVRRMWAPVRVARC